MVSLFWGAAVLNSRRLKPVYLRSKKLPFSSIEEATEYEKSRIREKLGKGYERKLP